MKNKSLYEDKHPQTSTKGTGFKNKEKALETLKIIKDRNIIYQKQVVNIIFIFINPKGFMKMKILSQ
jgi:hypothetical protein